MYSDSKQVTTGSCPCRAGIWATQCLGYENTVISAATVAAYTRALLTLDEIGLDNGKDCFYNRCGKYVESGDAQDNCTTRMDKYM